jgi:glucose-6-phosphate 1-dehydrogenase
VSDRSPATQPTILVIVGITGDLARRKLLPAICSLAAAGRLPKQLRIVGVTRRPDAQLEPLFTGLVEADYLRAHSELFTMDLDTSADYHRLGEHLEAVQQTFDQPAQRIFYLSVPPEVSKPIIEELGSSGLAKTPHTKLLLEKPFGTNLVSAQDLVAHIDAHFKPDQVYRIDHYLAKEMAQNLVTFREGNALFRHTWNRDFITAIEIVTSEVIGIEGRSVFYEQTGALRDLVQSHLLQLAALTLMPPPDLAALQEVPAGRLATLKQLKVTERDGRLLVQRGQYVTYRDEVRNPHSQVETFVDLTLESSDPTWQGVPIRLVTGKGLADKETVIRLRYRPEAGFEPNELLMRLQPDEGVSLRVWTKVPGLERRLEQHELRLDYSSQFGETPEAYERVLLDAIHSDHTLFASSEEVLESWRILEPVQAAWAESGDDLHPYSAGTDMQTLMLQRDQ